MKRNVRPTVRHSRQFYVLAVRILKWTHIQSMPGCRGTRIPLNSRNVSIVVLQIHVTAGPEMVLVLARAILEALGHKFERKY